MIRVNQLKLPIEHSEEMLRRQIIKTLRLKNEKDLIHYQIRKQSIDARRKNLYASVYQMQDGVLTEVIPEAHIASHAHNIWIRDHFVHP